MEDRKRSLAPDTDDLVPRPKRIKEENGAPRMSAENEASVEVSPPLRISQHRTEVGTNGASYRHTRRMPFCAR